jgi:Holliday junction DNA helicase RuvA
MISSLTGRVTARDGSSIELDVCGVGYLVHVPTRFAASLTMEEEARVLTHLIVREDAMSLFGFSSSEDREAFRILIGVTGVGPKLALAVLSALGTEGLRRAVAGQDVSILTEVQGIGKRGAERILVDLKERLGAVTETTTPSSTAAQVREALISLGYTPAELREVLNTLNGETSVEEGLRTALKELSRA